MRTTSPSTSGCHATANCSSCPGHGIFENVTRGYAAASAGAPSAWSAWPCVTSTERICACRSASAVPISARCSGRPTPASINAAEPPLPAIKYVLLPAPVIGLGLRAGRRIGSNTSETITNADADVRIALVLPDEVVLVSREEHSRDRCAPVLSTRLRVLSLRVDAGAVLAHRGFERDVPVRVDRVRRAADDRSRQPAVGREGQRDALDRHRFTGIAGDEHPFAALPLDLHHVKHVLVTVG